MDNDFRRILNERYSSYQGEYSFEESVSSLGDLAIKKNKAGELYIHHADDCGSEVFIPYGIDFIKGGAFRNQTELQKIVILAEIEDIPRYTFLNCSSLKEIIIPDSVTIIGQNAFEGCTALEHIVIPASVKEIKADAFLNCRALTDVEILNPEAKIDKNAFMPGCTYHFGTVRKEEDVNEMPLISRKPDPIEEEQTVSLSVESEPMVSEQAVPVPVESKPVEPERFAPESEEIETLVTEPVRERKQGTSKMLFCADVQLGAVCNENLNMKQSHEWQAARSEKLADLIDKAAQNNASYVALLGQMFGQDRVSESVIDGLFQAINEDKHIQILAFLSAKEYQRISYRNDIPQNLHLICMQTQDSYLDENIALRIREGMVELQLADNDDIMIRMNEAEKYELSGMAQKYIIPSLEPLGFENAEGLFCGYAVLDWTENSLGQYIEENNQKYAYKAINLKILPEDDEKEIVRKINNAVRNIDSDTFLRITITGKSAFGLMISPDALAKQLQNKIFYVEVYDHSVMDIDEEAFENDISLRSEFVRLALQDDSLSESERNRLISFGWNALNGRG